MTVEHLKMLHQGKLEGQRGAPGDAQFPESQCFDYRSLGFRECAAEVARYLTSVEGLDLRDPLRIRLMQHLQAYFAQREALAAAQVAAQAVIHPGPNWQAPATPTLHASPYGMGAITRGTPVLPGVPPPGAASLYSYFQPGASPVGSSLKLEGNPTVLTSSGGQAVPVHSSVAATAVSASQHFKLAELPYMPGTFSPSSGQPAAAAAGVKPSYMGWGGELVF
jgi:YRPW motif-containing protein